MFILILWPINTACSPDSSKCHRIKVTHKKWAWTQRTKEAQPWAWTRGDRGFPVHLCSKKLRCPNTCRTASSAALFLVFFFFSWQMVDKAENSYHLNPCWEVTYPCPWYLWILQAIPIQKYNIQIRTKWRLLSRFGKHSANSNYWCHDLMSSDTSQASCWKFAVRTRYKPPWIQQQSPNYLRHKLLPSCERERKKVQTIQRFC